MKPGMLHHIELYVSNLSASLEFWGWLLETLNYQPYQSFTGGQSWKLNDTYLVFVEAEEAYKTPPYHRKQIGLNHLAFHAASRTQVDLITEALRAKGYQILYQDQHPYAGGPDYYAVFVEDPDRIKVEIVAPTKA
ncbi:catechol 2,3-dioxygenase-like lactoylglutathione lyase family enzyme [Streptohalobacillus salinus]|uniref:Catechol 2,3-dioxygenase-like lactoylglutathione lyase family enzyme n=1 Tax=Streptohalobacillus salinus TaxID=621096 RepID=A0A2V3WBJ3_9BACI|nr:VOC family protein [Streptohalobacillus salinus]PXW91837.1 catechol 2,3-dioxygenase-like lactoylglutathione lyase family enzyme [Streptohalobacillus salinus]